MKFVTRLCAVVVLSVGLIAGCNKPGGGGSKGGGNGPGPVPPGAPNVTFEPTSGKIDLDSTTTIGVITITNSDSTRSVTLVTPVFTTPLSVNLDKSKSTCLAASALNSNTSCVYEIDFDQMLGTSGNQTILMEYKYTTSDGEKKVPFGNLTVNYTPGTTPKDTELISSPSNISFDVSRGSSNITVTLTNQDPSVPITLPSDISGLSTPFSSDFASSKCSNATLNTSTPNCTYNVLFSGTAATSPQTLTINYSYQKGSDKISKTLSTNVQATAPAPFKVFLNHIHDSNPLISDSNPLKLTGKVNQSQVSSSNYTSWYGFFDSLVIYNTSSSTIKIDNLNSDNQIVDVSGNPIADLKVDPSKCGVNPSLDSKKMCAFQVIYKPTKYASQSTAYLTLSSGSNQIKIPIQYSAENETANLDYLNNSDLKTFLSNSDPNIVAVYNNCTQPLWIASKQSPLADEFVSTKIDSKGFYVLDGDILKSVQKKHSGYALSQGYPSFNIHAKFGCKLNLDGTGTGCTVGEDGQPAIFPLFEGTFGCTETDRNNCFCKDGTKNCDVSARLIQANFFDLSLLQGFNHNMAMDIWKKQSDTDTNPTCFSNMESTLTQEDCPTSENLSSTPNTWAVMDSTDNRWNWTDDQPPLGWVPDYLGVVSDIGEDTWTSSIGKISEINSGGSSTSIRSQLYAWKTLKLKFQACNDSQNDGTCSSVDSYFNAFPYWDGTNYSPFSVCCVGECEKNSKRDPLTLFSMNTLNLTLKQNGTFFGCAAPAKYLGSSRSFQALGLGTECVYPGSLYASGLPSASDDQLADSILNSYYYSRYLDRTNKITCGHDRNDIPGLKACFRQPGQLYNSTMNNQRIMFENPYQDQDMVFPTKGGFQNEYQSPSATIYQELVRFCTQNHDFCQKNGTQRDSIAAIIGSMGPISATKYYQNLESQKKGGPNYIWQYGDQDAGRVCNTSPTKYVILFCGKTDAGKSNFPLPLPQQSALFKKLPTKNISKRAP